MESFVIPVSTIFAAVIAFIANYFTINKKISKLEEKVEAEQRTNRQLIEELKYLRKMDSKVDVQDNKIQKIDQEIAELKVLNQKVSDIEKQILGVETKMEIKFDLILDKLKEIK